MSYTILPDEETPPIGGNDGWKVSPEVQAARDIAAAKLKAQYEDPTSPDYDPAYAAGMEGMVFNDQKGKTGMKPTYTVIDDKPEGMQPVSYTVMGDDSPVETQKPSYTVMDEGDKPDVEQPGYMATAAQGLLNTYGGVVHAGGTALAGAVGLVSKDAQDSVQKWVDENKELSDQSFMTKEQAQNLDLSHQIVQGTAGALGWLAGGKAMGAGKVIGLMAGTSTIEGAVHKLQQNVDLGRAAAAGVVEGAAAAAGAAIPGVGTTFGRTLLLGAAGGVAQQAASDVVIGAMFKDRPDIQKQHELSWDKAIVAGATGAVIGGGLHGAQYTGQVAKDKVLKAQEAVTSGIFVDRVFPVLNEILGIKVDRYKPNAGETHSEALRRLLSQGENTGDFAKAHQALDLLEYDPEATTWQRAVAGAYRRRVNDLGLDTIEIGRQPSDRSASGKYYPDTDTITVKTDFFANYLDPSGGYANSPNKSIHALLLHEVTHAITAAAVYLHGESQFITGQFVKGQYVNTRTRLPLTEAEINIVKIVDKIRAIQLIAGEKFFDKVSPGWREKHGYQPDSWEMAKHNEKWNIVLAARQKYNAELKVAFKDGKISGDEWYARSKEVYGFKDVHEFLSEAMSNEDFIRHLKDIKLTPQEIARLGYVGVRTNNVFWDFLRQTYRQLLGIPSGDTLYDVAFDNITGLIDKTTGKSRLEYFKGKKVDPTDPNPPQDPRTVVAERFEKGAVTGKDAADKDSTLAYVLRKMSNVLSHVAITKDQMVFRMMAMSRNPIWRSWVKENADIIWERHSQISIADLGSKMAGLGDKTKALVHDDRSIDEFMTQEFKGDIIDGLIKSQIGPIEDLKGLGRMIFPPVILKQLKTGTGAKIMKWYIDKASEYTTMGEVLYNDAIAHWQLFNDLPRQEQLKLMDTIALYSRLSMRKQLVDAGVDHITEAMLRQQGHGDSVVEAYKEMTKGTDFLYSMINQARLQRGLEPIPKIPGYMPHVWDGAYKVLVNLTKISDKTGQPVTFVVAVKGFDWRQQAESFIKEIDSGKFNDKDRTFTVNRDKIRSPLGWTVKKHQDIPQSMMVAMQDQIKAYHNGMILDPQTMKAIEKIESQNMGGFLKHGLERSDVKGWIGEVGTDKNNVLEKLGIGTRKNNKILTLYQNYAKSVADYYRNQAFLTEVYEPLTQVQPLTINGRTYYGALLEHTKELKEHLAEFGSNLTGENVNSFYKIDNVLQDVSIRIGLDPLKYRETVRTMRNFLSLSKLRANGRNYVANVLQPMNAYGLLHLANEALKADGYTVPDPMKAMGKVMGRRWNPDKDLTEALNRARDEHVLDASLEHELGTKQLTPLLEYLNTLTGGKVNAGIESGSRETTFMMAFEHFKAVFKDNAKAYDAAVTLTKQTMVNYDHMSRPMMYTNTGVLGDLISPFAVFRNAYIGNTVLTLKALMKHGQWRPFAAQQAMFVILAGVGGIIGASEYNAIANILNSLAPEMFDLPTLEELAMKYTKSNVLTWGAVSEATKFIPGFEKGVYVGSSMNSVGADDFTSVAMLPFVQAIATMTGVSVSLLLSTVFKDSTNPDMSKLRNAGKDLFPGMLQGHWDKVFMKEGSNLVPQQRNLYESGYPREQADWNSVNVFGGRSLEEHKFSTQSRLIKLEEKHITEGLKNLVNAAVNRQIGIPGGMTHAEARRRAIELSGGDPEMGDKFDEMVANASLARLINPKQKEAELPGWAGERVRKMREKMGR